jgi:hypothetical protein
MAAKSVSLRRSPAGVRGLNGQAGRGRRGADELDDGADVGEAPAAPVDRDEADARSNLWWT